MNLNDTIVAQSTPQGKGAIGIIRLSGKNSITIINSIFPSKDLSKEKSHTIHFGNIEYENDIIDEVSSLISSNIFYDPAHVKIYEVIESLNNKGMIANPITLKNFFEKDNNKNLILFCFFAALATSSRIMGVYLPILLICFLLVEFLTKKINLSSLFKLFGKIFLFYIFFLFIL